MAEEITTTETAVESTAPAEAPAASEEQPDLAAQVKTLTEQLDAANKTIQSYTDMDIEGLKQSAADWEQKAKQAEELDGKVKALQAELLKAYRTKAALQAGLPEELADRLTGETEEDIRKDAELLAGLTKAHATPSFSAEGSIMDGVAKAFFEKNPDLKN